MYRFKMEKKQEFLNGRTATYLADNELYITRSYLTSILNGKRNCSRTLAMNIAKLVNGKVEDFFNKKGE
ncbi:MAG: helix-turn-helix transcriptional regulator [Bacilli bacterium]|nr:helix-turn-helix transcriptional regulator [Bacilli bacterium]